MRHPIYVEQDGLVARDDAPGGLLAVRIERNLLRDELELDGLPDADWLLAYSGTLAGDLFEPHPATWLAPGHRRLAERSRDWVACLDERGRKLCLQPHARHVLNDPPSCLRFVREHEGEPLAVALAPAALLEPAMLRCLDDHLERAFETLGPVAPMLLLHDAAPDPAGEWMRPAPLGAGVLPAETVRRLIERTLPPGTPIVLGPGEPDSAWAWLDA